MNKRNKARFINFIVNGVIMALDSLPCTDDPAAYD